MPTRADHHTGQWTMSFMGWEALPDHAVTLSQILGDQGVHTAAVIDTPFYTRGGMNYDRGFQSYYTVLGQEGSGTRAAQIGHHESRDVVADWRKEADRCAARTMTQAGDWLEKHYKEEFFLYIDTWDPHEPWDPPAYYAELYQPDYDGSIIQPPYAYWHETDHLTERDLETAFACYRGEITMVDTWIGYLLRKVENMGIARQHRHHLHYRPRLLLRRTRRVPRQRCISDADQTDSVTSTATPIRFGTSHRSTKS